MNTRIARTVSVILALTLIAGSFTLAQAKGQSAPVMSERLVNLAHFYKPPSNVDAPTLANKFGFVLLTGGDEVFRDKVTANGFSSTIPQYFMFLGIQDPGNCTNSTRNNQAAYKAGDFCDISQNHPDWFLLDANGQRIRMESGSDVYRMDPGNAEWRSFFLTRVLEWQSRTGWSGLFLDCLESSLGELQRMGQIPAKYPDDASYRVAITGFLKFLRENYSQPILANITIGLDDTTWSSYMQYLDGAMQERWAVDWDVNTYVKESKWEADLARAEKLQGQGKYLILVAPGNQSDANRQNFAFASYLLISNGRAAFRYSNSDVYREVWMYNNYQIDLGTPLGPRSKSGNVWKREFTKGVVTVDPVNHTAMISTNTQPASTPTTAASPTPIVPTMTPTKIAPTATLVQPTSTAVPTTAVPVQPTATVPPIQLNFTPTAVVLPTKTAAVQQTAVSNSSDEKIYDDKNPLFVYSTGWQNVSTSLAYQGSYKETTRNGVTVKFPFTGQSFSVLYKGGPYFNAIDVYVDGTLVGTINQKLSTAAFQQRWDYPGQLISGKHTLKLVFKAATSGMSRGSVDAVLVR